MPINTLNAMSSTASSNVDVTGVELRENQMNPSDVNNAIRGLMSILKNAEQGTDGFTTLKIGNWKITEDGSNNLVVSYSGTNVVKIASNGAITSINDVTAFGTI
jgi:hypothetical protein